MLRLVYVLAFAFVPTSVLSSNGKILYFVVPYVSFLHVWSVSYIY